MGYISALWKYDTAPDDSSFPYTPYTFQPINLTMNRDYGRRESVMAIPGMDDVIDANGRASGPRERVDQTFGFRKFTLGDNDAEYDRLAAWLATGVPIRLVYTMDSGAVWYAKAFNPRVQNTETSGGNWGHGGFQDFTITWRRGVWTPRFGETAEVFHTATTFAPGTTFGSVGSTTIANAVQPFTVDARGTPGIDLPTLDDTGATITIHGPAGGNGGIRVYNGTPDALVVDTNGARVPMYFDLPFSLPTANDSVTMKFASQAFTRSIGGVFASFRPTKPKWQREWFAIKAGALNSCSIVALGTTSLTGGAIKVDWFRKRA